MLSMPNKERDNEVDPENVLSTIVHPEEKLHWLEQKVIVPLRQNATSTFVAKIFARSV